jgi:tetratricopeptide (TPR) repeat protein
MIWLLALQLALPAQQQHYENAKNALAKMQFNQADEEVDQALKIDPNLVPALVLKARLAMFAHRPDVAKSCLIKAVAVEPSSENAQFFLGVYYYLQNDFRLGIGPLETAQSLAPKDPMPTFYLAMSKEALGDAPAALKLYEQAAALAPEKNTQSAAIHVAYGRMLYSLGRYDESLAQDEIAIAADAQSRDAWYEKAKGLEHQHRYQEAAENGEHALTLPEFGTSDSQIHFLLGNVYLKLNKPDLAKAHLDQFHAAPQTTQR